MQRLRKPAFGKFAVCGPALRCLCEYLRSLRFRVRETQTCGNHAEVCRGMHPLCYHMPRSRQSRAHSKGGVERESTYRKIKNSFLTDKRKRDTELSAQRLGKSLG